LPFRGFSVREIKDKVLKTIPNLKAGISESAKNLIAKLLEPDPLKRPSFEEIFNHPWMLTFEKEVPVFNAAEKVLMVKEYFLAEDKNEVLNDQIVTISTNEFIANYGFTEANLVTEHEQKSQENVSE
jgi:serine/threonine protein kinase